MLVIYLTLPLIFLSGSRGSRILFVAPTPSYSHQAVFQPIWRELSLRGHQVTVITPDPLRDPKLTNLTELSVRFVYSLVEYKYKFYETLVGLRDDPIAFYRFFGDSLSLVYRDELSDLKIQRLINDQHAEFDLVIFEFLLPTMVAFSHRFKCPAIAITSLDASLVGHDVMGNPSHPALNPDSPLKFNVPLTFFQRVFSVVYSVLRRTSFTYVMEQEDAVIAEYFGDGYPPMEELLKNVELFFMNVNPAFHNVRPTVPGVVHIGGSMSIRPPQLLPDDLQSFLDTSKHGVIYFSLGSNVKSKYLTQAFISEMIRGLSSLPYDILWRNDEPDLPGRADNIRIVKWVPQQDVLRHPNVKAFITQGGLQSLEEAINFKTPVLCIPYFGDQFSNCIQAQNKGMGLAMDYNKVSADLVKIAVSEVAQNPKYLEAVTRLADIVKDQPMTGMEKAIWWTEYVLRHKGAKHLRSAALDMPLYQYFLVDVLAFLLAFWFVIVYIAVKLVRYALRWVYGEYPCNETQDRQKKEKTKAS